LVPPEDSAVLDFEEKGHSSSYVSALCMTKFAGKKKKNKGNESDPSLRIQTSSLGSNVSTVGHLSSLSSCYQNNYKVTLHY